MITAIILAAGEGRRMGTLKQLLPWEDSTILETVIKNIAATQFVDDEIRVVLGAEADRVEAVLEARLEADLKILKNKNYQAGMLTTVWQGLKNLPATTEYIMLALGDQPLIGTEVFDQVLAECLRQRPELMVPVINEQRGHPLLINTNLVPDIYNLEQEGGLRNLLAKYSDQIYHFPVNDESIIIDLDYYDEYKRYKR